MGEMHRSKDAWVSGSRQTACLQDAGTRTGIVIGSDLAGQLYGNLKDAFLENNSPNDGYAWPDPRVSK